MPKPIGMGLEKQVIELGFIDGMKNKLAPEVRPDGQLYDITNGELDLIGKVKRRQGYAALDPHMIGPESTGVLTGTYRKIFQRDGELCVISDTSISIGSGAGTRSAGDAIFSRSSDMDGWKPHAKVPRATLRAYPNMVTGEENTVSDCAVTAGGVCIVAWYTNKANGNQGHMIRIVDLNTGATVLDTTRVSDFYVPSTEGPPKIQCQAMGDRLYVFYVESSGDVRARYYDTSVRTGALTPAITGAGQLVSSTPDDWDSCNDGSVIYFMEGKVTPGSSKFITLNSSLAITGTHTTGTTPNNVRSVALHVAFGLVSVAYTLVTDAVYFEQFNTAGTRTGSLIDMGLPGSTTRLQVGVLTLSSSRASIFVDCQQNIFSVLVNRVEWRSVSIAAGTSTPGSSNCSVKHVRMAGHAFSVGGHVCIPFVGWDGDTSTGDYAYIWGEIDTTDSSGFSIEQPLPLASFGQDIVNYRFRGEAAKGEHAFPLGCVVGNKYYYLARTLSEPVNTRNSLTESLVQPSVFTLVSLDFSDTKRWADAPLKQLTVLGSALPSCYDGRTAHECGFLMRPSVIDLAATAGGGLTNGKTYFFRVVYVWVDSFGNRWFSQPSYASRHGDIVSFTADVTNQSFTLAIRPLVLSAKAANSNWEQQDIQVWLFMTRADEPDDYFLHSKFHQYPAGGAPATDLVVMSVTAEAPAGAELIYTGGGELENYAPPPSTCIAPHRDRLLAISDSSNSLWYTKPMAPGRGVEWALEQQIQLPERGMGVVSNEAAAIIFTANDTYSLEGYGPSATGQPPDAFGRLIQVSSQIGLFERGAAVNTPVGVVFRSRQGWYVLRNTMNMEYIGADVEGSMQSTDSVTAVSVDSRLAVVRIIITAVSGNSYVLNYWYDTNRWSRDVIYGDNVIHYILGATAIDSSYYLLLGNDAVAATGSAGLDASGPAYALSITTGWFTFKNFQNTKRIWRVYATVKNNAFGSDNLMDLVVTVYGDWDDVNPIAVRTFAGADLADGVQTLRMHLPVQKLKAIKVKLEESPSDPAFFNSTGLDFLGLGFELGLKRGGPKLPAVATQ